MNIGQRPDFFGGLGQPSDPGSVVWTATDVVGMFVDAQDEGHFGEGRIMTYRRDEADSPIRAIVWYEREKCFSVFEMDFDTRKPRQVGGVRVKRGRPRLSREFKILRATKKWEDR